MNFIGIVDLKIQAFPQTFLQRGLPYSQLSFGSRNKPGAHVFLVVKDLFLQLFSSFHFSTATALLLTLLVFLIHTGVRIGEAVGVCWTDIDFAARVIHIRGQGKNRVRTKTGRTRQIEMSAFLVKQLIELRRQREKCWKGKISPHVFITSTGSPLDTDNFRFQQFYKLLGQAGIRRIRLHDLRHTFATIHLANGSPLQSVSKQLGHANIKMTCDVYYHYLPNGEGKANYSATIPSVPVKSRRKANSTNKLYVVKSA